MINRRRFLTYGLGMGAAGIAAACNKTAANGDHSMHGKSSAASSSMSHQNMDHSGHQMGGMNHAAHEPDWLLCHCWQMNPNKRASLQAA